MCERARETVLIVGVSVDGNVSLCLCVCLLCLGVKEREGRTEHLVLGGVLVFTALSESQNSRER